MKLDEIVAGFDAFESAMEANQGELTPELAETLDALHLAEKTKVDALNDMRIQHDSICDMGERQHFATRGS